MVDVCSVRRRAGLSQQQVADAAGVAQSTVSRLEGGHDVDVTARLAILTALGHRVEMHVAQISPWVDDAALARAAAMSPEQRIAEAFAASSWAAAVRGQAVDA